MTTPLRAAPPTPADAAGRLLRGRWVGGLDVDPVALGPRVGRVRRWCYLAAGDEVAAVGAAVVHLGGVAVAFAWACVEGRTETWEARLPLGRGARVASTPEGGADARTRGWRVHLAGDGGLDLDVPVRGERLVARVDVTRPVEPVVLTTPTVAGGWNATQKAAGYPVTGHVRVGASAHDLGEGAGGWRDWTSGRQDRHTFWRWAAGAGRDVAGHRVGLNASTGMNGLGPGEDLAWWDGHPQPLAVERLEPHGADDRGRWRVSGPGWELAFEPWGVRAADERVGVLRSRYTQPIGRFEGVLPGPEGEAVEVSLTGVTEDHLAVW